MDRRDNVTSPGDYIRKALESRGWDQVDLAAILGRPVQLVNEVITAKRGITPETAKGLAIAFDTSPELWMHLAVEYELSRTGAADPDVASRARIYAKGPIRELTRRGWLLANRNAAELAEQVLKFYELRDLNEEIVFGEYKARNSTVYPSLAPNKLAWMFGAKHLAETTTTRGDFSRSSLTAAINELKTLLDSPEAVRHVPSVLSHAGIRFLVVEALPQTRIDGGTFWLDSQSPVIVLSLRYDRIDYFWHTLMHEVSHVWTSSEQDAGQAFLDVDLISARSAQPLERTALEVCADAFAMNALIPEAELEDFIGRFRPQYPRERIIECALQKGVHPGILIGQLHYRGEIQYSQGRDQLVKVRTFITSAAVTDGWGVCAQ